MRVLLVRLRSSGVLPMLVVPVICAATMSWGADSHQAGFFYSCAVLVLAIPCVLVGGDRPFPVVLSVGFAFLCVYLIAIASVPLHVEHVTLWAAGAIFLCGRVAGGLSRVVARRAWVITLSLGGLYSLWALMRALTADSAAGLRLEGSFLSANTAATLLGMVAIMSVAELRRVRLADLLGQRRQDSRGADPFTGLVALAGVLFALTGVFLSGSRAGASLCVLALMVLIGWAPGGGRPVMIAGVFLFGGLAIVSGGVVADRFISVEESFQVRIEHFRAYVQAIGQKVIFGYGPGGFERAVGEVMTPATAIFLQKQGAAHNVVLQWLIQAGLAGSLMMWVLLGAVIRDIWSGLVSIRANRRILRAVLCISVFVCAHGMVDYALEIPGVMWWWSWSLGLGHGVASRRSV